MQLKMIVKRVLFINQICCPISTLLGSRHVSRPFSSLIFVEMTNFMFCLEILNEPWFSRHSRIKWNAGSARNARAARSAGKGRNKREDWS